MSFPRSATRCDWRSSASLADGSEQSCNALRQEEVAKSTMTHHWRVLRDSGVIWQRPQGRENMISLRREDLDARFPGLLDTLLKGHAAGELKACAPASTPSPPAADTGQSGPAHPPRFC
jgi:hypothetical protein